MTELQQIIESAFERRDTITPGTVDSATRSAILQAIDLLDSGKARVAEKIAEHLIEVRAIETDLRLTRNFEADDVGGDPFLRRVFVDQGTQRLAQVDPFAMRAIPAPKL